MRYYFFFLFLSSLVGICRLGATEDLDEKQELSFYRGYLFWQEHLQRPKMPYDLEQVIAGMQAAENGDKLICNEEKLHAQIRKFQEKLLAKQTEENLADAETFLAKIAKEDVTELISNKLYYKRLKNGGGRMVKSNSTPLLTYSVWSYNRWGEEEIISRDLPLPVMLENTIPGFAQGVSGMMEGEVRQLFIHPELAYGTYGKFDPNLLVIFKVEVISADDNEIHERS